MSLIETLWKMFGREDHNLFPLLRLILPHLDSVRPMYKVKEKQLAKMYVTLHSMPESGTEAKARRLGPPVRRGRWLSSLRAQELLNWKRPSNFNKTLSGNFPDKAISVVKHRCLSRQARVRHGLRGPWRRPSHRAARPRRTCRST